MANTIQIKRGTNLSNAGTPAAGELIFDSANNKLYVGDGSTAANALTAIGGGSTFAASAITSGVFADARIPNLGTSKITSGTFDSARIAHNTFHLGATSAETGRTVKETGLYTYEVNNASLGTGTETGYYEVLTYGEGTGGSVQLAGQWFSGTAPNMYFRTLRDVNDDWTTWQRFLTTSDEGSGNGLDADTLDGSHASAFLTSVPNHSANLLTSGTIPLARISNISDSQIASDALISGSKIEDAFVKNNISDTISHVQNAESLLTLHNNRQDAGNVPIFGIAGKQSGTIVGKMSFYRGSNGNSGYMTFSTKETNAASLTEKMRLDGAGRLGIGTNSPTNLMHINGSDGNGVSLRLQGDASYGATIRYNRGTSYNWNAGVGGASSSASNIPSSFWGIEDQSQSNAVRLAIAHTTGNVGIGNTSPSYTLHVAGHAYASSSFLGPNGSAGTPSYRFHNDGNTGMYLEGTDTIGFSTNGAGRFTMNATGTLYVSDKVQAGGGGIEIWDGTHGFKHVLGKDSTYTYLKNNDGVIGIHLGDTGDQQNYYSAGGHRFRSASAAYYMTLNSTGLKLGDGYATQKLDVNGNVSINGTGNTTLFIDGAGDGYTQGQIVFRGSDDDASYRGQGTFYHDAASDIEYFAGTLYANDAWAVTRKTSTASHDSSVAQGSHALLIVEGGGDVGIGENSPDTKLHIKTTGSGSTSLLKLEDNARLMYLGRDAIAVQDLSGNAAQLYINSNTTFSGSIVTGANITAGGLLSVTSSITTGYGVAFTNGNTNFLFYNNTNDNLFYLRDTTNGQMLQTWTTSSTTIHKPLYVTGNLQAGSTSNPVLTILNTATSAGSGPTLSFGHDQGGGSRAGAIKTYLTDGSTSNRTALLRFHHTQQNVDVLKLQLGDNYVRQYQKGDTSDYLETLVHDAYAEFHVASGNYIQIRTDSGVLDIGAMNTSHCHYSTDRANHWFNQMIYVNGGVVSSYNSDLSLRRNGSTSDSILVGDNYTSFIADGTERFRASQNGLDLSNNTATKIVHNSGGSRDKYRVWTSSLYAIGMDDAMSYGGLNDYAMTFQMNSDDDRGFVWLDSSHNDAQGAMSLTTNGKLAVAHSVRLGYGESDTTTPGATYRLDVSGSIGATADVVAYISSDKRLKDNIKNIANPLEKLNKLNGVEFDWNDKQNLYKGHDIGVIAQEVEEVLPEIVDTREDGHKAVKYDRMVALLIEAVKEQQVQINELKTKLGE